VKVPKSEFVFQGYGPVPSTIGIALPKTNIAPGRLGYSKIPKGNLFIEPNHQFSGENMLVSGRVC